MEINAEDLRMTEDGDQAISIRLLSNEQILLHVLKYLEFEGTVRLSLVSRGILETLVRTPGLFYVHLTFAARQKIRRQIFEQHPRALPSLFTHVFDLSKESTSGENVLAALLSKPGTLQRFSHERSGKHLKLYHPYFYRQLPLRLNDHSLLPPPIVQPQNVPLPHDLSLSDFLYIICIHHSSLRSISYRTYDSCPLAWNTTPSRVCPRDLIGKCLNEDKGASPFAEAGSSSHEEELRRQAGGGRAGGGALSSIPEVPYQIRIWCPDCKYSGADHDRCWLLAGMLLKQRISNALSSEEERREFLRGWADKNGLVFSNLEDLHISGWALANCLSLMRMMGFSSFPKLKKLKLDGLLIVAPSLTDAKDAVPRPRLTRDHSAIEKTALTPDQEGEKLMRLAQCSSFNYSPLCRRYQSREAGHYQLGFFNGDVWRKSTFPLLEEVSIRGQNFDDAARWVTPWFENCLSLLPNLRIMEIDHVIIRPFDHENDPLVRLFSMAVQNSSDNGRRSDTKIRFPKLEVVKLKMVDSPLTLLQIESTLSDMLGKRITVQARKILISVYDHDFLDQVNLIRSWEEYQSYRRDRSPADPKTPFVGKSCFAEMNPENPNNGLIIMNFDKTTAALIDGVRPARDVTEYPDIIDLGSTASKLVIKHYTPSDATSYSVLRKLRFGLTPDQAPKPEMLQVTSTMADDEDDECFHGLRDARQPSNSAKESDFDQERVLRRIDIQLDFPQVWQICEKDAMRAVESEIELLRSQLNSHPDLKKVRYVRVSSCTRLTYGGSNWDWWESVISGRTLSQYDTPGVGGQGWARESREVIDEELLSRYQCEHMNRARDEPDAGFDMSAPFHPAVGPERIEEL